MQSEASKYERRAFRSNGYLWYYLFVHTIMIIIASNDDHTSVEVLCPPPDTPVGSKITVSGFGTGEPDPSINLSSKDNIFAILQKELKTDGAGVANYKESPLVCSTEGFFTVPSLFGCHLG